MLLFSHIRTFLEEYDSLSLEEAESVKLMHRTDTKYVVRMEDAAKLLSDIRNGYSVLEIASQRVGSYESTYYDTKEREMFHTHITRRFPRYKIRSRHYSQNGMKFLEVKQKDNVGCTSKWRIPFAGHDRETDQWLNAQSSFSKEDLSPVLINDFDRITLINNERSERVTLDFNLQFCTSTGLATSPFDRVVIIELKQDKTKQSVVRDYLRDKGHRSNGMSKYCVGMLLLNHHLKYKCYKPNFSKFINTQYE